MEGAPEEDQDQRAGDNSLRGGNAKVFHYPEEQYVDHDVCALMTDPEAVNIAMENQFREPRIIKMALQINAGDDGLPKARDYQNHGDQDGAQPAKAG
jgi:hypothetical protein